MLKYYLEDKILIPKLEHFVAHEDKVFQTIFLSDKKIKYPKTRIISNYEEGVMALKESIFPLVFKTSEGWGSQGVYLIKNFEDGDDLLRKYLVSTDYPSTKVGKVLFQEFIHNLEGDWKILIFGDKVACLYRRVKDGDFRASGSGIFEFKKPSKKILDFAFSIKEILNCNWISLDIMASETNIYLCEYQVTHFGLLTALNCPKHYEKISSRYIEKSGPIDVDIEIAKQIYKIINIRKESKFIKFCKR